MTETCNNRKQADICCIGHVTLDKVITPSFEAYMPGGTSYYFAKALKNLDHSGFYLVASLGDSEMGVIDELRGDGLDVSVIPSRKSVFFENKYSADMNERTQRVLAKADPFTVESLKDVNARIFHLGTLLADDFSLEVIRDLASRGKVSVDVQGYLRRVDGEQVVAVDYTHKREAMPYIDILKCNENEYEVITGEKDPYRAAEILADWGCREVVLTLGDKGSIIYKDGKFYDIPVVPRKDVVDATGCGDTYMAGYLYKRSRGASIPEAGTFAAAMCTIKIGIKGPFSGTEEDVESLIRAAGVMKAVEEIGK